jgi:hypothetical protein
MTGIAQRKRRPASAIFRAFSSISSFGTPMTRLCRASPCISGRKGKVSYKKDAFNHSPGKQSPWCPPPYACLGLCSAQELERERGWQRHSPPETVTPPRGLFIKGLIAHETVHDLADVHIVAAHVERLGLAAAAQVRTRRNRFIDLGINDLSRRRFWRAGP